MTSPARASRWPDFLIIGAPKAGTTALHAGLAQHPELVLSDPKETKYFMCGDAPPPLYRGPGDSHSRQEWIWRRQDYLDLFADIPDEVVCGESTPFYLYDADAQRRIAAAVPRVRLIIVVRDPVDRAYSNWMHLWVDGLEPIADVLQACMREEDRVAAGWAPFWRYIGLGRYGEQLMRLRGHFPDDRILVLRYRDLIDDPAATMDRVCTFLGIEPGIVASIPRDNMRPFVNDSPRTRNYGRTLRAGAKVGAMFPPEIWRRASRPILDSLHKQGEAHRPKLTAEQRRLLLEYFVDDIRLLAEQTGESYDDWLSDKARGGFSERASGASG
jgi:hypothetical protein